MSLRLTTILVFLIVLQGQTIAQCGLTVDAGDDQVACEQGGTVTLNGNINGAYDDFFWTPPNNLSSTTTLNPIATVNGPFIYTLTATATSTVNMFVNGDFESGNTGFTTGYAPFDFSLPTEGEYLITDNPLSVIPPLAACVDHTSGTGNMMVADGATSPGVPLWCQTVPVNPNTDYIVGAWFLTHFINPPTIQFTFNGIPGGGSYPVPPLLCDWSEYSETWNSGINTTVTVCIEDVNTGALGNDIVIDDIYMYEVCEISDEVEVSVTDVRAQVAPPLEISCDNPQVTLDGSGSSAGPGYTYLWTTFDGVVVGGVTNLITQAGAAGTYTLTVFDAAGCSDEYVVVVEGSNVPPDINLTGGVITCDEPEVTLSAFSSVPNVTYMWTGPDGFVSNQQEPLVSEPGLYSVTVIAPNGCRNTQTITIDGDSTIPALEVIGDTLTCNEPEGQLSSEVNPPVGTYSWQGPGGFNSSSPDPLVSDTGMYILTFTNLNGCTAMDTAFVSGSSEPPVLSLSPDTLTCLSDTLELSALTTVAGFDFEWTGPGNFTSVEPAPEVVVPGSYYVTVSIDGACTVIDSVIISIDTLRPVLTLSGDTINCNNDTADILATHNAESPLFLWTGPSGAQFTDSLIQVASGGWYFLELTTKNGCSAIDSIEIMEDIMTPDLSVIDDTLNCFEPVLEITVTSPSSIQSYLWSGPDGFSSTDAQPLVDGPGQYEVIVTAPNGCTNTDSLTIYSDFEQPDFSLTGDTIGCTDGMVRLFSNIMTSVGTLTWTGPGNFTSVETDPFVSQAGWYFLTVTGENGCSRTDSVEVFEDGDIPDLIVTGDTITCDDTLAILEAFSQTPGVIYNWTGPGSFSSSASIIDLTTGGTYTITLEAPNGCTASSEIVVEVDTISPVFDLIADTITCLQPNASIEVISMDGIDTLTWAGPNGFTSSQIEPLVSSPGFYTILVTGENGCIGSDSIEVLQDADVPEIQASGATLTCNEQVANLIATSSIIGSQFTWTGPGGIVLTGADIAVDTPGTYNIEVVTPAGCAATEQVVVLDSTMTPEITINGENIPCDGSPVLLFADVDLSPADINWTGPMGFSSVEVEITVSVPGEYTAIASIPTTGCSSEQTFQVDRDSFTITGLNLDVMDPGCGLADGSIDILEVIGGNLPFEYALGVDTAGQAEGFFDELEAGSYQLFVTDASGCTFLDTVTLSGGDADFFVQLPDTIFIQSGQSITLDPSTDLAPSEISQVIWTPDSGLSCNDCLNPMAMPVQSTMYTLTVYDIGGCANQDMVWIIVREDEVPESDATIYVPNAFSPGNRDGINDRFTLFSAPGAVELIEEVRVFNRWGDEIYIDQDIPASDPAFGWDGTFRDMPVDPDVYIYLFRVRMSDGTLRTISGDVTVIN